MVALTCGCCTWRRLAAYWLRQALAELEDTSTAVGYQLVRSPE
jgi:hypothetical protein